MPKSVVLSLIFISILILIVGLFQTGPFLTGYIPSWAVMILWVIGTAVPLLWLALWNRHEICLILASIILLTGDFAPALTSPVVAVLTLPNFIYLLYIHRRSRIKYYLLPLVLLAVLYFFSAFITNAINRPIMITNGITVNMGWLGSFGGGLILYHMMYIPLLLRHIACKNKPFFSGYGYGLSLFVNGIALLGIIQYITGMIGVDPGMLRVSSIMRMSTRLGPFLVISLPLFIAGWLNSERYKQKVYWTLSIIVVCFALLLTATRGALISAGILWGFLLILLMTRQSFKQTSIYLLMTFIVVIGIGTVAVSQDLAFFERFQPDAVESGLEKRLVVWSAYLEGMQVEQTSNSRSFLNFLLGYGWFTERQFVFPYHNDPHNTIISTFSTFGFIGFILYSIPYVWLFFITFVNAFRTQYLKQSLLYGMACTLLFLFIVSGLVHNKLYSPIESAYTWLLVALLLQDELCGIFPRDEELPYKPTISKRKLLLLPR